MGGESTAGHPGGPGGALTVSRLASSPRFERDVPYWEAEVREWRVRFYGRGAAARAEGWTPVLPRAWLAQVHGADVVAGRAGDCGAADALALEGKGIAAAVATADCLPIALLGERRAVLVHAGWRGLAAGIVERAIERLGEPVANAAARIGPAIGVCCYEVGEEVVTAVGAARPGALAVTRPLAGRPRLDLTATAAARLRAAGVGDVAATGRCTRCHPQWLWSHRRDGARAGRNWALLWRQ